MKNLLLLLLFFILMFGCTKSKDDTTPPPAEKPKVTLMLANQINVNNHRQQMVRIGVRYQATGLHEWNYMDLGEGYQGAGGNPTYHAAGYLPLDEFGKHEIQIFFADGGMAYWKDFMYVKDKFTYLHAWTNSNGNGAFVELDGIPAQTKAGF